MKRHAVTILVALAMVIGGEIHRWRRAASPLPPIAPPAPVADRTQVMRLYDARDILGAMIAFRLECTPPGYERSTDSESADWQLREMLAQVVYPVRMGISPIVEEPYEIRCCRGWIFMRATAAEHHAASEALGLLRFASRQPRVRSGPIIPLRAEQLERCMAAAGSAPPLKADPLDRVLPEFHVVAMGREEALRQWSRQSGVPIEMDWAGPAGAAESVTLYLQQVSSQPVTLHLRQVSSRRALEHLLEYGAVWYRFDGRAVTVSPNEERPIELRVYDVRDLSQRLLSYRFQELAIQRANSPYILQGQLAVPYPGLWEGVAPNWHADEEAGRLLHNIIESSIERDSWSDNGGRAPFSYIGGLLLIGNSRDAHDSVEQLLNQLRTEPSDEFPEDQP